MGLEPGNYYTLVGQSLVKFILLAFAVIQDISQNDEEDEKDKAEGDQGMGIVAGVHVYFVENVVDDHHCMQGQQQRDEREDSQQYAGDPGGLFFRG